MIQFERTIRARTAADADFIIIGGFAAILNGSARNTVDLDVCFSRAKANLTRIKTALAPFHPRPRGFAKELPFVWDEAILQNCTVLTLQTDLGDVDLLAEVAGIGDYEAVKAQSKMVDAFEQRIAVLDLRGLLAAKLAAGRTKDLSIIPELESLLEAEEAAEGTAD